MDFLIVALIVRDEHRIEIVVANLPYCIGPIMKASISRRVPQRIRVVVVKVAVDIVNSHRLLNIKNKTTNKLIHAWGTKTTNITITMMMMTMMIMSKSKMNEMIPLKLQ